MNVHRSHALARQTNWRWLLLPVAAALVYLLALGALYVPRAQLSIGPLNASDGALRVWFDRGRGFYIGDSLAPNTDRSGQAWVDVPRDTTRLRIDRASNANNPKPLIVLKLDDRRLADACQWLDRSCSIDLRGYARPIPFTVHLLLALLSLALACGLVASIGHERLSLWRPARLGFFAPWLLFGGFSFAVSRAGDAYRFLIHDIDKPPYWPISVFDPVAPNSSTVLIGVVLAISVSAPIALRRVPKAAAPATALALGTLLMVSSNLLHGWTAGLVTPNTTYWADALSIRGATEFMRGFNEHQHLLGFHSRTHPPGAVLVYYFLHGLLAEPARVSFAIGLVAFFGTGMLVYRLLRTLGGVAESTTATLLLLFLPALQIYFVASLDALICLAFTATVYASLRWRGIARDVGVSLGIGASMLLSFASLWLLATLFGFELATRRLPRRLIVLACAPVICILTLRGLTAFDWVQALRVATQRENPGGFWLLANPGTYFFTRLEGLAELTLFASPVLVSEWLGRLHANTKAPELVVLSKIGVLTLIAMLLTGAFKTGETARACLFVYPLFILPFAHDDGSAKTLHLERHLALGLIAQTVLMQLFGNYYW